MQKRLDLDPASLATNPRASVSAWERYHSFVEAAYAQHPTPYVFFSHTFSSETIISRLRDAIRGALAFDYPTTIPREKFQAWYESVVVSREGKNVRIGPPLPKKLEELNAEKPIPSSAFIFSSLTPDEVASFILLLANGRIIGPVEIRQSLPDLTTDHPNVMIIHQPNKTIFL